MTALATLQSIAADNRAGLERGIASWCTAHPETLRAILRAHRGSGDPILIEATCNQVNQHGGYTGLTPSAFRTFVEALAAETAIDPRRIILGGDHLGPNPWKARPALEAMAEARAMVRAYVEAGFTKIHLDASMVCAGDGALSQSTMAERAAELCAVAEEASGGGSLAYVIGTEVPVPGGETDVLGGLAVTRPEAALRTFDLHRSAFSKRGLGDAMDRVIGLVVQPGVDFGNSQIFAYDRTKAAPLSAALGEIPGTVYEAHSTDYQSRTALGDLVSSHFAILKVGPELTFAFREAVVAMAAIEERLTVSARSDILDVIAAVMDADPRHWRGYIKAGGRQDVMRLFGLSDRVRYYWPDPRIAAALKVLMANIDAGPVPPGLLWQFAGPMLIDDEALPLSQNIMQAKVGAVAAKYRGACRSAV